MSIDESVLIVCPGQLLKHEDLVTKGRGSENILLLQIHFRYDTMPLSHTDTKQNYRLKTDSYFLVFGVKLFLVLVSIEVLI